MTTVVRFVDNPGRDEDTRTMERHWASSGLGRWVRPGRFVDTCGISLAKRAVRQTCIMDPVDPDVFAGRDPAWRMSWEALDPDARQRVSDAVAEGKRVGDTRLEPFVYGMIAKRRRQQRWRILQSAFTVVLSGFWVAATTVLRPSPFAWFFVPALIVALIVPPVLIHGEARRLDRAEVAQTSPPVS
jgi:hypothetical protein